MPKVGTLRNLSEKNLSAMRCIRDRADRFRAEERKLTPEYGRLAVGSAHFDPMLYAEVLEEMLRWYGKGWSANKASDKASELGREVVRRWNANPRGIPISGMYELHRDKDCAESIIQWALIILTQSEE